MPTGNKITKQSPRTVKEAVSVPSTYQEGAQQGLQRKWYPFFRWGWEGVVSLYFINMFLHLLFKNNNNNNNKRYSEG